MHSTSVGTPSRPSQGLEEDDEEPPVVKFGVVAVGLEEGAAADEPVMADGLGGRGVAEGEVDEAAGVVVDGVDPGGANCVGPPNPAYSLLQIYYNKYHFRPSGHLPFL